MRRGRLVSGLAIGLLATTALVAAEPRDKFGQPIPQAPARGQPDKFAAPPTPVSPPAPEAQAQAPEPADKPPPAEAEAAAPPAAPSPPAAEARPAPPPVAASRQPIPPDEPAALGRLRALLGPQVELAYDKAEAEGDGVRLTNLRAALAGGTLTAPELRVGGIGERGIASLAARGLAITGPDGSRAAIETLELAGLAIAAAAQGVPTDLTLDRLRLEGVAVQGDPTVALAELTLERFGGGRSGTLALQGLDVLAPQASDMVDRLRIGRITLSGLDIAAAVTALMAGDLPARGEADYAFELAEARASKGDAALGSLARLRFAGSQGAVESSRVDVAGLTIERSPLLAEWMDRFGYRALTAEITNESRFDRSAQRLETPALAFGIRDMGAIGLTYRLSGVTAESAERMDFDAWRLDGAQLRIADQSFYQRLVRDTAKRERLSEQRVRERFVAEVTQALGGAKAAGPLLPAVQRFLRGEATTLEVVLKPSQPVGFAQVERAMKQGPAAAQRLLGVTATAR